MPTKERVVFHKERDVRRFVNNLTRYAKKALDLALLDGAEAIEAKAIDNLYEPYNRSGRGRDGGAVDTGRLASGFRGVKGEPMRKVVGNNGSYAAHMEFGTGAAIGQPKYRPPDGALSGWAGRHGKEEEEVNSNIWNFGTEPRRYLRRALHEEKGVVPKKFAEYFARKVRRASGIALPDIKSI